MSNPSLAADPGRDLLECMDQEAVRELAARSTFRFVVAPSGAPDYELDFSRALKDFFMHPTETRHSGFTFWPVSDFTPSGDEWRGKSPGGHIYRLTRAGCFEFDHALDEELYQWLHHKYPSSPPWLYPLTVCEMTVSCCRYVHELVQRFGLPPVLLLKQEYLGVQGYWLPHGRPDFIWSSDIARHQYPKPHIRMKPRVVDFATSEPDAIAFELVKYVYTSFGMTEDDIPYFDENRNFVV